MLNKSLNPKKQMLNKFLTRIVRKKEAKEKLNKFLTRKYKVQIQKMGLTVGGLRCKYADQI